MKFHYGMTVKEILKIYGLSIKPELPSEILDEEISVYGLELIYEIDNNSTNKLDEKIKEYFSSDKFVEDAKRAALELSSKLECNLYYLQIYYTPEHNISMQVDIELKEW